MLYSTLVLVTPSALVSPRTAARRAWHHCDAAWRPAAAATAMRAGGAAAVARSAARPEALAAGGVRGRAALHHRRLRARRRRIPWQRGAAAKSARGGSTLRASPLALVATARRWRREGAVGCAAPSAPLRARSRWCEAAPRKQLLRSVATAIFFAGGSGCRCACESRRLGRRATQRSARTCTRRRARWRKRPALATGVWVAANFVKYLQSLPLLLSSSFPSFFFSFSLQHPPKIAGF